MLVANVANDRFAPEVAVRRTNEIELRYPSCWYSLPRALPSQNPPAGANNLVEQKKPPPLPAGFRLRHDEDRREEAAGDAAPEMFKDWGEASVLQAFRISFLVAIHFLLQRKHSARSTTLMSFHCVRIWQSALTECL